MLLRFFALWGGKKCEASFTRMSAGPLLQFLFAPGDHGDHPEAVLRHDPLPRRRLDGLRRVADRLQIPVRVGRTDRNPLDLRHDRTRMQEVVVGHRVGNPDQIAHVLERRRARLSRGGVVAVDPTDHRFDVHVGRGHVDIV